MGPGPYYGPGYGPRLRVHNMGRAGVLLVFCVFQCILVPGEAILMPILVDIATLPKLVQFSDYTLEMGHLLGILSKWPLVLVSIGIPSSSYP